MDSYMNKWGFMGWTLDCVESWRPPRFLTYLWTCHPRLFCIGEFYVFYSGLSVRYLYGKGQRYLPDHPPVSPEFPKSMRAESCCRAPALS